MRKGVQEVRDTGKGVVYPVIQSTVGPQSVVRVGRGHCAHGKIEVEEGDGGSGRQEGVCFTVSIDGGQ